ncbi:MAG: hypothetical protein ACTSRU_17405 [Candidatus Hodarchaeales archaeon]
MALPKQLNLRERKVIDSILRDDRGNLSSVSVDVYKNKNSEVSTRSARVSNLLRKTNVHLRMEEAFESQGLGLHQIVEKFIEKTNAKRKVFFSSGGVVTDTREVDDNDVQLKALIQIAELCGLKINQNVNVNMNADLQDLESVNNNDLLNALKDIDTRISELESK